MPLFVALLQLLGIIAVSCLVLGQAADHCEVDAKGETRCQSLESEEQDVANFLQSSSRFDNFGVQPATSNVHFFLGKGKEQPPQQAPEALPPIGLAALSGNDSIPATYWSNAAKMLNSAGMSTPLPSAATINAQPKAPTPMPWQMVMSDPLQPLDTKIGGAIMSELSGQVTPTPPPSQPRIDMQFVAQCPMVLFNKDISVRGRSCGNATGKWIDPSPFNPRSAMSWSPLATGGLRFGVDSAMAGKGAALFADVVEEFTMKGYKFTVRNCLGIDRWILEEAVYKVENVGKVTSTLEMHDVNMNSVGYFFRYIIKNAAGEIKAESSMYRLGTDAVNFTEWKDERNTGKILAVVKKQGQWDRLGWRECMAASSPRGWNINFPTDRSANTSHATQATVQDIRVAIAAAITLMAHRDEKRGSDGINTEGTSLQISMFVGGIILTCLLGILATNCCMVFKSSGISGKAKRILFDIQGTVLPKAPHQARVPAMHATY